MSEYVWQDAGPHWWFTPSASAGNMDRLRRAVALVWLYRGKYHVFMCPGGGSQLVELVTVATAEEGKRIGEALAPIYASMELS